MDVKTFLIFFLKIEKLGWDKKRGGGLFFWKDNKTGRKSKVLLDKVAQRRLSNVQLLRELFYIKTWERSP